MRSLGGSPPGPTEFRERLRGGAGAGGCSRRARDSRREFGALQVEDRALGSAPHLLNPRRKSYVDGDVGVRSEGETSKMLDTLQDNLIL